MKTSLRTHVRLLNRLQGQVNQLDSQSLGQEVNSLLEFTGLVKGSKPPFLFLNPNHWELDYWPSLVDYLAERAGFISYNMSRNKRDELAQSIKLLRHRSEFLVEACSCDEVAA